MATSDWVSKCKARSDSVTCVAIGLDGNMETVSLSAETTLDWESYPIGCHERSVRGQLIGANKVTDASILPESYFTSFHPSKRIKLPKGHSIVVRSMHLSHMPLNTTAQSMFKAQCRGVVLVMMSGPEGLVNYPMDQFRLHWSHKPRKVTASPEVVVTKEQFHVAAQNMKTKLNDIGKVLAAEQQSLLFQADHNADVVHVGRKAKVTKKRPREAVQSQEHTVQVSA